MITSKDFCVLYSSFYGETIDCLEQLKHATFDGHELFEFIKYVEQNLANGDEQRTSNCNIPLVSFIEERAEVCEIDGCDLRPYGDLKVCKHHFLEQIDKQT